MDPEVQGLQGPCFPFLRQSVSTVAALAAGFSSFAISKGVAVSQPSEAESVWAPFWSNRKPCATRWLLTGLQSSHMWNLHLRSQSLGPLSDSWSADRSAPALRISRALKIQWGFGIVWSLFYLCYQETVRSPPNRRNATPVSGFHLTHGPFSGEVSADLGRVVTRRQS